MKGIGKTIRRRRMENKTDYKARLGFLKSGRPRVVIRRTNKYVIVQIVESDIAQDRVLFGASSKDLISKGWPKEAEGSLKSLPACYLTGLLLAKKAKDIKEPIVDIGLHRNVQGNRIFAVVKGLVDGGLSVPHNSEALPSEERLSNERVEKFYDKVKEKISK